MKIKKILFCLIILGVIGTSSLYSQEGEGTEEFTVSYHTKGDKTFTIEAGMFIPLMRIDPSPNGTDDTGNIFNSVGDQMNLGGVGMLSYCTYVNNNLSLGGEFGGMFGSTINENMFYMVPFMVKAVYDINLNTYFTVPIYLSAGITLNTYEDFFSVDPIITPGVGLNWNYDSEWSFGAKYLLWIVPEIASEDNQTSIGVHSDFRLAVTYHF